MRRLLALAVALGLAAGAMAESCWVVVGTRLDGAGRGLSIARFDLRHGVLDTPRLVYETSQPVFWTPGNSERFVYVCHGLDRFGDLAEGFVSAFEVDTETGALTLLNQAPIGGRGASHVSIDHSGRWLFEASYRSGSIAVFRVHDDGSIGARTALVQHSGRGPDPERQTSPHPHAIYADPSNRFAVVPDLGLDKVFVYAFNGDNGGLVAHDPAAVEMPAGSGPRHLAWHPQGDYAYVTLELTNTVAVLAWEPRTGRFAVEQVISALPATAAGKNTAAEIAVHPSGRFVYASNRGAHNSIAVFAVDPQSRRLSAIQDEPSRGLWPRNFSIHPDGKWMIVSNHDSDSLAVFAIDPDSGRLTPVGEPVPAPNPFGTRFLVSGAR